MRSALRHATLWPLQNHRMLASLSLLAGVAFVNLWIASAFCLHAPRMLFGVETQFTMSPRAFLSSTFIATMAAAAWLCVDPVVKAAYALRVFYAESFASGEDLRAGLRILSPRNASLVAAAMLMALAAFGALPNAAAADLAKPASTRAGASPEGDRSVDAGALDEAIGRVIRGAEYEWRAPREKIDLSFEKPEAPGWLQSFGEWAKEVLRSIGRFLDRLFRGWGTPNVNKGGSNWDWSSPLVWFAWALVIALVIALGFYFYKRARRRVDERPASAAPSAVPPPDLRSDEVSADQLPGDEWVRLAAELASKGELRLAMRAYYLASLAMLASRQWVAIARHKSNRDYLRDIQKRAHALPELHIRFEGNVELFDRVWYGKHPVAPEQLGAFAASVSAIRERTAKGA